MLPLTSLPAHGLHPPWGSGCARREALVNIPVPVGGGVCAPPPIPLPVGGDSRGFVPGSSEWKHLGAHSWPCWWHKSRQLHRQVPVLTLCSLPRLYLSLVLGNVNVTLLSKQAKYGPSSLHL